MIIIIVIIIFIPYVFLKKKYTIKSLRLYTNEHIKINDKKLAL